MNYIITHKGYILEQAPLGWKCKSPENKYWQTFGSTPTQALEAYITKEITNIPR